MSKRKRLSRDQKRKKKLAQRGPREEQIFYLFTPEQAAQFPFLEEVDEEVLGQPGPTAEPDPTDQPWKHRGLRMPNANGDHFRFA